MKPKNKIYSMISKHSRTFIAFLCVVVFSTSVIAFGTQGNFFSTINDEDTEEAQQIGEISKETAEKQIIVKYKNNANSDKIKSNIKKQKNIKDITTKKKLKNSQIEILELEDTTNTNELISALKLDGSVEYVQPNYILNAASMEEEPDFSKQWGLLNSGEDVDGYIGRLGVDINITLSENDTEVLIGILDTGIDTYHMDLAGAIYTNTGEIPDNGIDDDGNGYIDDINGWNFFEDTNEAYTAYQNDKHGTMVAGIIGAEINDIGISGVAPNVKLVPLKFMDAFNGTTADAIEAILYAENLGVKIINCSFTTRENNIALKEAMANSDILFVCAAGNAGTDTSVTPVYPACFNLPNIISVGAIDQKGILTSFSNYGNFIDIAAPGTSIYTTLPNNEYKFIGGTSMSAAFVSGAAARILGSNNNLTVSEIKARIKNNTTICASLDGKVNTSGRLNLNAALLNTSSEADDYNEISDLPHLYPEIHELYETDDITLQARSLLDEIDSTYDRTTGINFATGSLSMEFEQMKIEGYDPPINISLLYFSKPATWKFNFKCSADKYYTSGTTTYYKVSLPNGNSVFCRKYKDGNDYFIKPYLNQSIDFTVVLDSNSIILTLDFVDYYYQFSSSSSSLNLTRIIDKQGKVLYIDAYDKLTDYAGNEYAMTLSNKIAYEIQKITNTTTGNYVNYNWADDCISITDFSGTTKYYTEIKKGKLKRIVDKNDKIIKEIEYYTKPRTDIAQYGAVIFADDDINDCISSVTNEFGHKINLSYSKKTLSALTDLTYKSSGKEYPVYANQQVVDKCVATYKDNDGIDRKQMHGITFDYSTYWDEIIYPSTISNRKTVTTTDEANGTTVISYKADSTIPVSSTDRNNNTTQYAEYGIFDKPKKIINPDNSIKLMDYDSKGNLIFLQDEAGKVVLYRYTYDDQYLTKVEEIKAKDNSIWTPDTKNGNRAVKDTSGQPVINDRSFDKCAITTYEYKTTGIKGLLEKITSPEGIVTNYTYDSYGNLNTSWTADDVINPNGLKKSTYSHYIRVLNSTTNAVRELSYGTKPAENEVFLGTKIVETSPEGYITANYYDPKNLCEKIEQYANVNNKSVTRIVYDAEGRKIQEISPNEYNAEYDDLSNHKYNDLTVGQRITYHSSGKIESSTDSEGNTTTYIYDPVSTNIS